MRATSRIIAPMALALALAACADADGEDDEVSRDAAEIAEDSPAIGPRSEADVAGVTPTDGQRWFYKPATQTALWGESDSEGIISLSCNESMTGDTLIDFQWIAPATEGADAQIEVRSGDFAGSIDVTGKASVLGPDAIWQGGVGPDDPVIELLASTEETIVFSNGQTSIATTAAEPLRRAIAACQTSG